MQSLPKCNSRKLFALSRCCLQKQNKTESCDKKKCLLYFTSEVYNEEKGEESKQPKEKKAWLPFFMTLICNYINV